MKRALKEALAKYDAHMDTVGGCSDGYCLVKRPVGMHTNGGCRCMDDKYKGRRVAYAAQELRAAVAKVTA